MTIALTPEEIVLLTGYEHPSRQLEMLHKRGFHRAFISRHGVVLERVHYEAVCKGQQNQLDKPAAKAVNLAFFGVRK